MEEGVRKSDRTTMGFGIDGLISARHRHVEALPGDELR